MKNIPFDLFLDSIVLTIYIKMLSYDEFINKFPTTTGYYYKWLNKSRKHFNHVYTLGLNTDSIEFMPTGDCQAGGLYFTNIENIPYFLSFGTDVAIIELCKDAQFYIEFCGTKAKTNKFIVKHILSNFFDMQNPETSRYNFLQKLSYGRTACDEETLRKHIILDTPSDDKMNIPDTPSDHKINIPDTYGNLSYFQIKSKLQTDGLFLKYVPNQTLEFCEIAVANNGLALQYVHNKNRTNKIVQLAIAQNPDARAIMRESK
jgi:hypothetical protein